MVTVCELFPHIYTRLLIVSTVSTCLPIFSTNFYWFSIYQLFLLVYESFLLIYTNLPVVSTRLPNISQFSAYTAQKSYATTIIEYYYWKFSKFFI